MIANDIQRLRDLGKIVKEYSEDPLNEKHKIIWTNVNDLRMVTPAVLTRDLHTYLIEYNDELTTKVDDPFFSQVEASLLFRIYEWKHLRCHSVIDDIIYCPAAVTDYRFKFGPSSHYGGRFETAVSFDRVLDNENDISRIAEPEVIHDEKATREHLERMDDVFHDILQVKMQGVEHFYFAPWDDLLSWMNIERGMIDFWDNPDFMHKAIKRYVDMSVLRAKRYEELGLVSSNNRNVVIAAGGYGYTSELPAPTKSGLGARLMDVWGDGRDQIFTSVSPDMTLKFAFNPEKPWYDLFGLNCYGCCEDLCRKVDEARHIPRLRKLSVSPYADLETAMERMRGDIVVSYKPNPNYLAMTPWPKNLMRADIIKACELARKYGCSMEILMKTLISLDGDPTRLWEWCEMATDIAGNY